MTTGLLDALLRRAIEAVVRNGTLRVTTASGATLTAGDGGPPRAAVRLTSAAAQRAVLLDPELRLGEAFMDGTFVVEEGHLVDVLRLMAGSVAVTYPIPWVQPLVWLRGRLRRIAQRNRRAAARQNAAHHYDLDGRVYDLFLDTDRQYSCAYFETPTAPLDDAQRAKKRHIAAKLRLAPGLRVLDIGCGWGGLALYLAGVGEANVTGLTLSAEQLALAQGRTEERQLDGRVAFRLQDYRDVTERFDRIVSVGMFEHVGVGYYDAFFRACARTLADDGIMLLHAIGRSQPPSYTSPWIARYVFPGGYIPALSEVLAAIERAGLLVTDIEILRLHYAETLKIWRERFLAHRDDARELHGERFVRMWEFYLAASEAAFREQAMMVFQIQLAKRQGVVPITRDYIAREEQRLRARERPGAARLRIAGA